MSLAACYVMRLECDDPLCRHRHRGFLSFYDSGGDAETFVQARNDARSCGWKVPDRQGLYSEESNPVICPDCLKARRVSDEAQ